MGVMARVSSGTLRLSVDDIGLAWQAELPDTSLGNDILREVSRAVWDYFAAQP